MTNATTHFAVLTQTARGVSYRKVSAARAARIMAAPTGAPALGNVLALYASTAAYDAAGESAWRAKSGFLPVVWEWNGVGVTA